LTYPYIIVNLHLDRYLSFVKKGQNLLHKEKVMKQKYTGIKVDANLYREFDAKL